VTLIVDAAPIVAMSDPDEPRRSAILDTLRAEPGVLAMPAPVTAEIDYLLGQCFGRTARSAFLRDLATGRFDVACLEREDYKTIETLEGQYADLDLGLADCAIAVLAERFQTNRILSFDERHFRAVTPLQGGAFQILPADG
jgi:predicted nucleic acid-binding protein